jgi:hypothetical protein
MPSDKRDQRLQEIIEFATTDAYTPYEQMGGWAIALNEARRPPFPAEALGIPVTVLEMEADEDRGLKCLIRGDRFGERWVDIHTLDFASLPEEPGSLGSLRGLVKLG